MKINNFSCSLMMQLRRLASVSTWEGLKVPVEQINFKETSKVLMAGKQKFYVLICISSLLLEEESVG